MSDRQHTTNIGKDPVELRTALFIGGPSHGSIQIRTFFPEEVEVGAGDYPNKFYTVYEKIDIKKDITTYVYPDFIDKDKDLGLLMQDAMIVALNLRAVAIKSSRVISSESDGVPLDHSAFKTGIDWEKVALEVQAVPEPYSGHSGW